MLTPNIFSYIFEKKVDLNEIDMQEIFDSIQLIPKYFLKQLSEHFYEMITENANKKLKKHVLGRTIFHLYTIDRLDTYVGMEKLIYAGLIVDADKTLEKLHNHDETEDLARLLQYILDR